MYLAKRTIILAKRTIWTVCAPAPGNLSSGAGKLDLSAQKDIFIEN
jgi:hypothetical protein